MAPFWSLMAVGQLTKLHRTNKKSPEKGDGLNLLCEMVGGEGLEPPTFSV